MKSTKILSIIFAVALFLTSAVCITPAINVAAAESNAMVEYDWNIADLDFSKISDLSSLPSNFTESHQEHEAGSCEAQHGTDFKHMVLENGEIGFSPLQTGKIGGVNYTFDKPINSGKVVISAKYQAYAGETGGNQFNMHIHAVDPSTTVGHGNGQVGASHLFMLSVDASGNLVLTGKKSATVTLKDTAIPADSTNRQEIMIVIDFDTEEVTVQTSGKTLKTTFEELGHDNANLKKVSAVGFGFGYTRNLGVSNPWNRTGHVSYLKISDGTSMGEHTHTGTEVSGTPANCGVAGTKSYYTCRCGKVFEDAECTKEITNLDEWKVIEPLTHTDSDNDSLCDNCGSRIETEDTEVGTATEEGNVTTDNDATETGEAEESKNDGYIYIICAAAVVVLAVVLFFVFKKKGNK